MQTRVNARRAAARLIAATSCTMRMTCLSLQHHRERSAQRRGCVSSAECTCAQRRTTYARMRSMHVHCQHARSGSNAAHWSPVLHLLTRLPHARVCRGCELMRHSLDDFQGRGRTLCTYALELCTTSTGRKRLWWSPRVSCVALARSGSKKKHHRRAGARARKKRRDKPRRTVRLSSLGKSRESATVDYGDPDVANYALGTYLAGSDRFSYTRRRWRAISAPSQPPEWPW